MGCHCLKKSETYMFVRHVFPFAMLWALLAFVPVIIGQHLAGSHSGALSGGHMGGISDGGFHRGFSASHSFGSFSALTPRSFSAAPRLNWTAPPYSFAPQRNAYAGYRPLYGAENRRGWDHRGRSRRSYPGYGYSGYPYTYASFWELLPWDIGYPDFAGYGDDDDAAEPNNAQVQSSNEEEPQPPQEGEGYRPEYVRAPYQSRVNQTAASAPPQIEPQLTLIFKDGHTQSIQNYVLTPKELIVMDYVASGRIPRISLSDLNLPATEKAAQRTGLDFSLPSA